MGRRGNGAFGMAEATPWRDRPSAYFATLIIALPTWRYHAPAQAGTPVPLMQVGSMEPICPEIAGTALVEVMF